MAHNRALSARSDSELLHFRASVRPERPIVGPDGQNRARIVGDLESGMRLRMVESRRRPARVMAG